MGEYERAISDYTKAIDINPRFVKAYYNRGLCCADNDEYDRAISDWTKAIEIDPLFADAYNNRGFALAYKGEYDRACSDLQIACDLGFCKELNWAKKKGYCK